MNFRAPRGTHDIWGEQAKKMAHLENAARSVLHAYNYSELRTPIFEDAGLFTRSIGDATDIVEKEMYVFADRKDRKLALRPEGTASIVRAYIENGLAQKMPVSKFFYSGPMFRYERPQAGRYREFYQIGAEYFGDAAPFADAQIMLLARDILAAVGLAEIKVHVNSLGCEACRPAFREALKSHFSSQQGLCEDCVRRLDRNPLRVLDCKIDSPRFTDIPHMEKFLCEACRSHFCSVQELLKAGGCAFDVDPRLVRGIDYYTRTIFEIRSAAVGSQDALAAGGRYDNLIKELGGPATPAVGFALGSERVLMAAENLQSLKFADSTATVFVAVASAALAVEAFALSARLRKAPQRDLLRLSPDAGISVEGPYPDKSLKSQFRLADKLSAAKVVVLGEEEFKRGTIVVRDMKTQTQEELPLERFRN